MLSAICHLYVCAWCVFCARQTKVPGCEVSAAKCGGFTIDSHHVNLKLLGTLPRVGPSSVQCNPSNPLRSPVHLTPSRGGPCCFSYHLRAYASPPLLLLRLLLPPLRLRATQSPLASCAHGVRHARHARHTGLKQSDLLLVHWTPTGANACTTHCDMIRAQWKAMEQLQQSNLTVSIGVSNYCIQCLECLSSDPTVNVVPASHPQIIPSLP